MKINNIVYLTDDYVYLKHKKNNNIIKYKLNKNIVEAGKIANQQKFIKSYEQLLNINHLNNSLFGETIKILISPNYNQADIRILKNLFMCFNYRKVIVENIFKILKLDKNSFYINGYEEYIELFYLDEFNKNNYLLINTNLFFTTDDFLKYLKYRVKNKELYLLGNSDLLSEIFTFFEEKYNNKTFMFSNNELYLINKAKF